MDKMEKGDYAEQLFILKAFQYELKISRPLNPSSPYDFILDNSRRLIKIQVKSCFSSIKNGVYCIFIGNYSSNDFDYLAAYIHELNRFYLIPFSELFSGRITFKLNLDCKFEKYVENFAQLV